jgi:hypothetical protein
MRHKGQNVFEMSQRVCGDEGFGVKILKWTRQPGNAGNFFSQSELIRLLFDTKWVHEKVLPSQAARHRSVSRSEAFRLRLSRIRLT